MKLFSAFILLFLILSEVSAQIPVGHWRTHLPYSRAVHVAYSPQKVYCTTGESLFAYKLNDNSIEKFSKINGLSDFGISAIAFSELLNMLVIGYDNGNIDLVKGRSITNISDLKRKSLPANKAVNHILFDGKMAFLSCGFGMILLDLEKAEIRDTYIFGPGGTFINVNSAAIFNKELFAATASGIFRADKTDAMLVDYSRWTRINTIPNSDKSFRQIKADGNSLYAIYNNVATGGDSIYIYSNGTWNPLRMEENTDIFDISFSDESIFVSTSLALKTFDRNLVLKKNIQKYTDWNITLPRETVKDNAGNLWIADFGSGLVQYKANQEVNIILPNGPSSSRIKSFLFNNNKLYTTAGGVDATYNNLYYSGEFSVFENDEWKPYFNFNHSDFMVLKTDPADKDLLYLSSWGSGIFIYKNGELVKHYNESNSTLQTAISGAPFTRIWGMEFDKDENLWVANSYVNNSLSVLKRNGEWKAYPLRSAINAEVLGDIIFDDYNQLWVVLLDGGGILVLDSNNTPDNTDDDRLVRFRPKNAHGQTVSNVFTIQKDMKGDIWVGTDLGPVVYSSPDEIFEGNTDGKQPVLPRPGSNIVDPLLGNEVIRSIAVDGANRKWIGTERGGAFLVSADGDSSLLQFNMDNSPILSNTVTSIGIHDKTGEVFFGTDRGIISYRSDATKAEDDFGDVYAFPNPVRPDYQGNVIITGLVKDANVKITDIAGNLVFETTTLGGQAVWDGNNLDGRRVASGVYLIFCSSDDGSKTYVSKLLFLR